MPKKNISQNEKKSHRASKLRAKEKIANISRTMIITGADGEPSGAVATSAMDRAIEVQASLPGQFPSALKQMLDSHVSGGFWLNMPKFSKEHLPSNDSTLFLVDEKDERWKVKYLKKKNGLSGGWRRFSIVHELVYGDVLVFQLIKPDTLKVYIIRASQFTEVDGAIGLLKLEVDPQPLDRVEPRLLLASKSHEENDTPIVIISDDDEPANDVDSESEMDIRFSEQVLLFQDVKTFKDFEVHVDGVVLDSEIPNHVRETYYELCRSQNMFLHENITGYNIKLVTGMISETVNITDALRLVKSTTPVSHIQFWDRTLKAFEELGMTVGFLRARIHKLLNLDLLESKAVMETKKRERDETDSEMKCLKGKLRDVRAKKKKLDAIVAKDQDRDSVLKEIAGAPW